MNPQINTGKDKRRVKGSSLDALVVFLLHSIIHLPVQTRFRISCVSIFKFQIPLHDHNKIRTYVLTPKSVTQYCLGKRTPQTIASCGAKAAKRCLKLPCGSGCVKIYIFKKHGTPFSSPSVFHLCSGEMTTAETLIKQAFPNT